MLDRSTNAWTVVVVGGGGNHTSSDGVVGASIAVTNPSRVIGFDQTVNKLFVQLTKDVGASRNDSMIKAYDLSDSARQSHIAGVAGVGVNGGSATCAVGSALSENCTMPYYPEYLITFYDSANSRTGETHQI